MDQSQERVEQFESVITPEVQPVREAVSWDQVVGSHIHEAKQHAESVMAKSGEQDRKQTQSVPPETQNSEATGEEVALQNDLANLAQGALSHEQKTVLIMQAIKEMSDESISNLAHCMVEQKAT